MKKSLTSGYFYAFVLVLCFSVLVFGFSVSRKMNATQLSMYRNHLRWTAELLESVLAAGKEELLSVGPVLPSPAGETATRLSIILPDGTVVTDSHYDTALLDNHSNRPEVRKAFTGKAEYSVRWSETLKLDMLYYAMPVFGDNGVTCVIRTSIPMGDIADVRKAIGTSVAVIALVILLAAFLFTFLIYRKTSRPLEMIREAAYHYAAGELEYPLHIDRPRAIRDLADDIRTMAGQLIRRINLISRQRNELEAVFANMVEAVVVLDEDLVIKAMNPAACRLAGVAGDRALRKRLIEVFRNSGLDDYAAHLVGYGESPETEIRFSVPLGAGGGGHETVRERSLQVHGAVFEAGKLGSVDEQNERRVLLVLHDITELKRLEQIRKDFVANVSHELRTPITSLKGYVETLLDGALDDRGTAVGFLNIIASQTERINAIVTDLLILSRLEQADSALETEVMALKAPIERALGVCRRRAEEKDIRLELECPEDLSAAVNSLLLEQALVNLVDNAVTYSERGASVRITAAEESGSVGIRVEDSGCGIPEKDLPRLFERFYRVDRARSREMGGTGLGLAIVKHIAGVHNGGVTVQSREGRGSVFTLSLPLPERS